MGLVAAAVACSGGSGGGTFSILDGVNDDAPTHGYESPNGGGSSSSSSGASSSSSSSSSSGGRDGGSQTKDASTSGDRPVACGTVLSCTIGESKSDVTYDCNTFRSDGKIVNSQGAEQGTWTARGTTITIVLKGADGGGTTPLVCTPKSASSGGDAG